MTADICSKFVVFSDEIGPLRIKSELCKRPPFSVSTGQTLQTAAAWFCMPHVFRNLRAVRHVYGCLAYLPLFLVFPQLSCKPSPARSAAAAILATLLGGQASSAEESTQGQDMDSYPARASNSEGEGLSYDGSSDDTSIKGTSNKRTSKTIARCDAWRHGGGDKEPRGSVTANFDADTDAESGVIFREWCLPFPPKGDENLGAADGGGWGGGVVDAVHSDDSGAKSTADGRTGDSRGIRVRRVVRGSPSGESACVETPASTTIRGSSPRYHGSPRLRSANRCDDALDDDIAAAVPDVSGRKAYSGQRMEGWTPSLDWRGNRSGTEKSHAMADEERQSAREDDVASANADAIDGGDAGGAGSGDLFSPSLEDLGDVPKSESMVGCRSGSSSSSSNGRKRKYSRKDKVRGRKIV